MKSFKKQVLFTEVKVYKPSFNEEGNPELVFMSQETFIGKYTQEKALKEIRKTYNDPTLHVGSVHQYEKRYEMSYQDFIQSAKCIDIKKETEDEK